MDARGFRVRFSAGQGSSPLRADRLWSPPSLLTIGHGGVSPGVKWLWREAGHSTPYSVEVKNAWSYTSTPPHIFMAWCLVKHRENFILPLPYINLLFHFKGYLLSKDVTG
jgi:hypothetical protein